MKLDFLDGSALDGFSVFVAEEVADELSVFFVVNAEFSLVVVFELRVVNHLLRDTLASEKEDSFDVEIGFLTSDGKRCEDVLSEVVHSLEETVHQVGGLVENNTFTFVLVVLGVEEGVSFFVVVVEEVLHTFTLSVSNVNEVVLEIVEDQLGRREEIKGIFLLLGESFFFSGLFSLLGGSSGSLLFFLRWGNDLHGLSSELDVTDSLDNFGESKELEDPLFNVSGNGLSSTGINGNLEGNNDGESANDISNSESVTNKVLLSLQVDVEESDGFLKVLDGVVVD